MNLISVPAYVGSPILFPNKPTSTNLYCVVCDQNYKVIRSNCVNEDCKGNVISEDETCLTCRTI